MIRSANWRRSFRKFLGRGLCCALPIVCSPALAQTTSPAGDVAMDPGQAQVFTETGIYPDQEMAITTSEAPEDYRFESSNMAKDLFEQASKDQLDSEAPVLFLLLPSARVND